jgi:GT2 family glycosyltransferase
LLYLTVAIPTFGREQILLESLTAILALKAVSWELLLVDQTPVHEAAVERQLTSWQAQGQLRWIRQSLPSITMAMNRALQEASGSHVLFLDDDIRPDPNLLAAHQSAIANHPTSLIAGRVLQPWHKGDPDPESGPFQFNTLKPRRIYEFMGGNFTLPRNEAIAIGGFDEQFVRVAYRFEAEFAYRWCRAGYSIQYEPKALIHHLMAVRGGTRSYGKHLTTAQPSHAVGRYYFLLRTRPLLSALSASACALILSVRTRHHLRGPWWIPFTLLAELRGLLWALQLHRRGPRLIQAQSLQIQQSGA